MMIEYRRAIIALTLVIGVVDDTLGDAIVVTRAMKASTIAEVFIEEREIRVEIEVGARDLTAFQNVLPDELYEKLTGESKPFEDRLGVFLKDDWVIHADDRALTGSIQGILPKKRVMRDDITGEPLPVQPSDAETVIIVDIVYPLDGYPQTIALRPPLDSDANVTRANVGFVAYHKNVAVNDFRYLSREETLDLDWEDPWHSRFQNSNLRRQFDSPMSAFLYVEHFEVRKEIIVRPKDLQQWIDLGIDDASEIPVDRQNELKQRAAEFLAERSHVTIDGKRVEGRLDRVHFIRRSLRKTGVIDPPEDLDATSATLGVIYVYATSELPKEVTMTWELFGNKIQNIPVAAVDEAGGLPSTLTPDDRTLRWQNFLTNPTVPAMMAVARPPATSRWKIPVLSAVCAAMAVTIMVYGSTRVGGWQRPRRHFVMATIALLVGAAILLPVARAEFTNPLARRATVDGEDAKEITAALLHNVYRSFDRRDEHVVYDRLAMSIAGELLTEVYLQTRRSIEIENQGGARVRVKDVNVRSTEIEALVDRVGFTAKCEWTVAGSVGHWGHTHQRSIQYEARFTAEPRDEQWKITEMEILQQERLTPK